MTNKNTGGKRPSNVSGGGGVGVGGGAELDLSVFCDKLEELIAIFNDAGLVDICQKLLDVLAEIQNSNESLQNICEKLEKFLTEITAELTQLCDKIEQGNEDILLCFQELKDFQANLLTCLEDLKKNDEELITFLESVKTTKAGIEDANYEGAFRYINGRPPASSAWALIDNRDPLNQVTVASGSNLNEFTADLESKGYTEWNTGEEHWVCPCPPGLTFESTGAYFTTVDGETSAKLVCTPLAEVPDLPLDKIAEQRLCAIRTLGCLDKDILSSLRTLIEKQCETNELLNLIYCGEPATEEPVKDPVVEP